MLNKMYGYRQSNNNLTTNLNSISSSLSSIDTIGRRNNANANNNASADNLITLRSNSVASTSLLWRGKKDDRYASIRHGNRLLGSEIYYGNDRSLKSCCFNSEAALNFLLVPLLLFTIIRQVFDFLGQIWLQIIINFFTIILIIFALFGIKQRRISYLTLFTIWAVLSSIWNLIVICIYLKIRDVGLTEDALSFYSGATSWWHLNGPGCLPYNISTIQPPISILQPNVLTSCRIDYHLLESAQAAIHSLLSLIASFVSFTFITALRKNPTYMKRNQTKSEKLYRLNNLMNGKKINQDPFPNHSTSRHAGNAASLRRSANKTSSRSSQHSLSSMRSARRRNRQSIDLTVPTPRGSTSSAQRSQKYGSLSSRRSGKRDRRVDGSSLTYGSTGEKPVNTQRKRQSSLSSIDYLPSYQPPHSSKANLLSSYGEISSIDSYNNNPAGPRGTKNLQSSIKSNGRGNANPTYSGSKSSICSHNTNSNNYDDLNYVYGNSDTKTSESIYGASTSSATNFNKQRQPINQRNDSVGERNRLRGRDQGPFMPIKIQAETYHKEIEDDNYNDDVISRSKNIANGGGFYSFTPGGTNQSNGSRTQPVDENLRYEINNNIPTYGHKDQPDGRNRMNGTIKSNGSHQNDSRDVSNMNQQQIYSTQRATRHPIYSNHNPNGNSETPI